MVQTYASPPSDFIREIIDEHLRANRFQGRVATRFPPEPNGYLHIGHAKSVCLNFGIADQYKSTCNLRMDDTDPAGETLEYVESIINDVHWLGFDWEDRLFYASDYFEQLYQFAVQLIKVGKAYVCSLSADEIREQRGTLTEPGNESPYRNALYTLAQIKTFLLNNRVAILAILRDKWVAEMAQVDALIDETTANATKEQLAELPNLLAQLDTRKAKRQMWDDVVVELRDKPDADFASEVEMG